MSRSSAETTNYHHGNLRQALLDAARAISDEGNLEQLTLREVARRAGVSHAAPYHHFKDKAAIVSALALESDARLEAAMRHTMKGVKTPEARLNAIGVAYIVYAFEHPNEFRLLFRRDKGMKLERPEVPNAGAFSVLYDCVAECIAAKIVPFPDVETGALYLWALVHGLATLIVDGPLSQTVTTKKQVKALAMKITGDF
jgi:AcrR family transcriptional regulator